MGAMRSHPTVLVVDDEPLIRWSLRECLAAAGYQVVEASDGTRAVQYVAQGEAPVDLVLLDLRLPDRHGLDVLEDMKRIAPRCPVILITASTAGPELSRAARSGAAGLFVKPFDLTEVVSAVSRLVAPPSDGSH